MLARRSLLLLWLALVLAACSDAPQPPSARQSHPSVAAGSGAPALPRPDVPAELLVLGSQAGVTVLDPATGSVRFSGSGTPAFADWSKVFTATTTAGTTVLREYQTTTAEILSTIRIPGELAIRVVSDHGGKVALMAPLPAHASPWTPRPHAFTDIVVADPIGVQPPMRFHLKGNFEPEAFSSDGRSLFMIRYLPPTDPVAYQVASLDLVEGKVLPVFGRQKAPVETMRGTRLQQISSPDGTRLYTLYTSQPPAYAEGHDAVQARAGHPVAFIHTLALDGGWAICIGLPKPLWGGDPASEAMAVSPDGGSLYVADTARGVVAEVDTANLKVVRTRTMPVAHVAGTSPRAAVSPDGLELFVADGASLMVVDTDTLQTRFVSRVAGPVSGLAFGADGSILYLRVPNEVEVVSASSRRHIRMIAAPGPDGVEALETLAA